VSTPGRLGWFHRYPARFGQDVVNALLDEAAIRLDRQPKLVLDAFAGTGTTLAISRRRGLPSVGVELSRLGVLIAELRLEPPDDLNGAVERVEEWVEQVDSDSRVRVPEELVCWLGRDNAILLGGYLRRLRALRDRKLKRFITVALSSSLRPASAWLPGSIKPQVDPTRTRPSLGRVFAQAARRLAADCRLERLETEAVARPVLGSALALPLDAASVDAAITSPPYYVTYDYLDVQRLSFLAFGWARPSSEQVGRRYYVEPDGIGFSPPKTMEEWYFHTYRAEETVLGRALRAYLRDMQAHFAELRRVVAPRGVAAYAVGNSTRAGRSFDLAGAIGEMIGEAGFADVEVTPRAQTVHRILPAGRDVESGRFSGGTTPGVAEYVVWARCPD
jgi:hypothetical protein